MLKIRFFLLLVIMTVQSCQMTKQEQENKETPLIGSWKFIADQVLDSNDNVKNEDTNVEGLLIYTLDGKMSVQLLWRGSRTSFITDTIMKHDGISYGVGMGSNTWTLDQARKLIDTYDAYFGNYSVDFDKKIVTHTISGNLRPEKEGTSYKRAFQIVEDTLYLRSADPDPNMKWRTKWVKNK